MDNMDFVTFYELCRYLVGWSLTLLHKAVILFHQINEPSFVEERASLGLIYIQSETEVEIRCSRIFVPDSWLKTVQCRRAHK